jgi:hypothetical protein
MRSIDVRAVLAVFVALAAYSVSAANANDDSISVFNRKIGNPDLSDVKVDSAPGSISATSLLGLAGDTVTDVQNPRDITVFLQAFDSSKTFGLSVTPARTALVPMSISTYATQGIAGIPVRLLASTTLGYAQATTRVDAADYRQQAWSIETSAFLDPDDDPLLAYTGRLARVRLDTSADNPCVFAPAAMPVAASAASAPSSAAASALPIAQRAGAAPPPTPAVDAPSAPAPLAPDSPRAIELDKRAAKCHALVAASMRWNTSRVWLSFASGTFRGTASGSPSHGLGRTVVAGISWGIGGGTAGTGAQLTAGLRRSLDEPVLATYGDASPQHRNSTLGTLRAAYGKSTFRALAEASNAHDEAPGASGRTFKRAIGIDLRLSEGIWLDFRVGRQRRIDDLGDETGSSIVLNISPTSLISFGS